MHHILALANLPEDISSEGIIKTLHIIKINFYISSPTRSTKFVQGYESHTKSILTLCTNDSLFALISIPEKV